MHDATRVREYIATARVTCPHAIAGLFGGARRCGTAESVLGDPGQQRIISCCAAPGTQVTPTPPRYHRGFERFFGRFGADPDGFLGAMEIEQADAADRGLHQHVGRIAGSRARVMRS